MDKKTIIDEIKYLMFILLLAFFFAYFVFGVLGKANWVPLFIFICGIGLMSSIYSKYEKILIKRWGDGKFRRMFLLLSFLAAPCSILGGIAMIFADSFPFGVSLALMGVYPIIAMNLRKKSLSNYFESSSDPSFFVWYWALGMLLCFPVIYPGFTYFTGTTESWLYLILTLILGLVVSTVMLSPDKIDRIAPVDMMKGNGVFFMLGIGIVLIYGSFCVMGLLDPNFRMW